jgi:hypothetical protein
MNRRARLVAALGCALSARAQERFSVTNPRKIDLGSGIRL